MAQVGWRAGRPGGWAGLERVRVPGMAGGLSGLRPVGGACLVASPVGDRFTDIHVIAFGTPSGCSRFQPASRMGELEV